MRSGTWLAALFLLTVTALAVFAPLLASEDAGVLVKYGPDGVDLSARFVPPGNGHLLGTDELGRDVLTRGL